MPPERLKAVGRQLHIDIMPIQVLQLHKDLRGSDRRELRVTPMTVGQAINVLPPAKLPIW